jgi:hypothetical protein
MLNNSILQMIRSCLSAYRTTSMLLVYWNCLSDLAPWFSCNSLALNLDKLGAIIIGTHQRPQSVAWLVLSYFYQIRLKSSATPLITIWSFNDHVAALCETSLILNSKWAPSGIFVYLSMGRANTVGCAAVGAKLADASSMSSDRLYLFQLRMRKLQRTVFKVHS